MIGDRTHPMCQRVGCTLPQMHLGRCNGVWSRGVTPEALDKLRADFHRSHLGRVNAKAPILDMLRLKLREWLFMRRVRKAAKHLFPIVLALMVSCLPLTPASRPVCAPCLQPASGPVVLDEAGVRKLLAGVEREEGEIAADRDKFAVRASNAERYAHQVKLEAIAAGTSSTVLAATIAAIIAYLAARANAQQPAQVVK